MNYVIQQHNILKAMKKLLNLIVFCFFGMSFAQNDTIVNKATGDDKNRNETEILSDLEKERLLRQERIRKVVEETKIPYSYITTSGEYHEIVDVYPDGTPIYYQSFNSRAQDLSKITTIKKGGKYHLDLTGNRVLLGVFDATPTFKRHDEFRDNINNIHIMSEVVTDQASLTERRKFQTAQEHSTHVTGTIIAKGIDSDATGIAPNAILYSYNWRDDEINMRWLAFTGGVTSNHSYGTTLVSSSGKLLVDKNIIGAYDWKAEAFDRVTFKFKNYLPVVAAGNYHRHADLLNYPGMEYNNLAGIATAKNVLVVGAIEEFGGLDDLNSVNIADFSNYGPTRDFRIKPDIVARGVGIYSPINDFSKTDDYTLKTNRYTFLSGTSMASPVVTGTVALFQEWAQTNYGNPLWGASIKGLFIHTAYPITEVRDHKTGQVKYLGEGPNAIYGWGAIDADKAMKVLQDSKENKSYIIESELKSKETKRYIIENTHRNNDIEVTLVWADPAFVFNYGLVTAGIYKDALINDLDLRVKVNDDEYYMPWALNKDLNNLTAKQKDNDVDNVERIAKKPLPTGESEIIISTKEQIVMGSQSYALIITSKEPIKIKDVIEHSGAQDQLMSEEDVYRIENPNDGALAKIDDNNNSLLGGENSTSSEKTDPIHEEKIDLIVWPNPVKDVVHFDYDETELTLYELHVFDMNGKLIRSDYDLDEKEIPVNQSVPKGFYIMKILTSKGIVVKNLVKQ